MCLGETCIALHLDHLLVCCLLVLPVLFTVLDSVSLCLWLSVCPWLRHSSPSRSCMGPWSVSSCHPGVRDEERDCNQEAKLISLSWTICYFLFALAVLSVCVGESVHARVVNDGILITKTSSHKVTKVNMILNSLCFLFG